MSERDANQLAADVPEVRAVLEMVRALLLELPTAVADDVARRVDELVGLVGTLQQRLDDARVLIDVEWPAQMQALEAEVGTLQQERDEQAVLLAQTEETRWAQRMVDVERRVDAVVALVGTLQQEHDECKALGLVGWRDRAVAAEAALATTRQALTDVARVSDEQLRDGHPGIPEVARLHRIAVAALDALAGTGGDTAPWPCEDCDDPTRCLKSRAVDASGQRTHCVRNTGGEQVASGAVS